MSGQAVHSGSTPAPYVRPVDLGPWSMRLSSNVPDFAGAPFFWRTAEPTAHHEFEVRCLDTAAGAVDEVWTTMEPDPSTTARRMLKGHYSTHHFGAPVRLRTDGRRLTLVGPRLERVVWPYVVKHLLTWRAIETGQTHLKAAAMRLGDRTTLVVGRSGGGKTVFLSQACARGATFVSNTHVLLADGRATGLATAMRVRPGEASAVVDLTDAPRHLEGDERLVAPDRVFPSIDLSTAPVANVVIVDHDVSRPPGFVPVAPTVTAAFMAHFADAVTTYAQKNDVLAQLGHDVERFAAVQMSWRDEMERTCATARCFVANVDMTSPATVDHVLDELARTPAAVR